jgi:hypothetical protein
MDASIRAELIAEHTPDYAINGMLRVRRDNRLAERAGVLPYEEWRKQQVSFQQT